jgi:hypothetical protein
LPNKKDEPFFIVSPPRLSEKKMNPSYLVQRFKVFFFFFLRKGNVMKKEKKGWVPIERA